MQPESFVDAVTAVNPIVSEERPNDPRMYVTGTLRQRGTEYLIEQRLNLETGDGPQWATPRIHRVMATEATRAALQAHLDQLVTISGTPESGDARHRTAIVLESVQSLE
jgi:hypothetical protein